MARPARPWFRFYVEAMRDMKLRRLTPAERWMWVGVLAAARDSCVPGTLLIAQGFPYTIDELATFVGVRSREMAAGMEKMISLGMVVTMLDGAWSIPAWNDRQYESDSSTIRTAKHRSKEQDGNVPGNDIVTYQIQRQNTETEIPIAPRARDVIFDALCEVTNTDPDQLTSSGRGSLNRAVRELRALAADPAQIKSKAAALQRRYPTVALTAPSLVKHWASLNGSKKRAGPVRSIEEERAEFAARMAEQ